MGATEGACAGAGARAIAGRVRGAGGVGAGTGTAGSRAGNSAFAGKACADRLYKVDADAVESGPARTGISCMLLQAAAASLHAAVCSVDLCWHA